jgi:hypothetical protein
VTKQSGMGDYLLIDGYDFSGDIGSIGRIGGGPAASDVTGITSSAMERIGLLRDGGIDFTSWFNPSTDRQHDVLSTLPYASRQETYCRGLGLGSQAASCVLKQLNYDPTRGQDGALSIAISGQADAYGLEWGVQLTPGKRTEWRLDRRRGQHGIRRSGVSAPRGVHGHRHHGHAGRQCG